MTAGTVAPGRLAYGRAQLAAGGPDSPIRFHASTALTNRYGYKLNPKRWKLANYKANPILGWAHDMSLPPIGRSDVERRADGLHAVLHFDQDDEFATAIERKIRGGFLSAVSVSWDFVDEQGVTLDWPRLTPEQIWNGDVWYDLAEISVVPVPGDPKALREKSRLALADLGRELLDACGDGPGPGPGSGGAGGAVSPEHARQLLATLSGAGTVPGGSMQVSAERARDLLDVLTGESVTGGQRGADAASGDERIVEQVSRLISDAVLVAKARDRRDQLRREALRVARERELQGWDRGVDGWSGAGS